MGETIRPKSLLSLFVSSLSEDRSRPPALRERAASNSVKGIRGMRIVMHRKEGAYILPFPRLPSSPL